MDAAELERRLAEYFHADSHGARRRRLSQWLVHGHAAVSVDVVRDVLENHLVDLVAFVAAVRDRIAT